MPFDQFPYTNFHELNLDWIIKKIKEIFDKTESIDESVAEASGYADAASDSASDALAQANRAQSIADDVQALQLTEMVIFGDSWSDPDVPDAIWGTNLGTFLNLNVHNYAKNGASMTNYLTNNLDLQISNFTNDTSFEKNAVRYVIIMGGINDYRYGVTYSNLRNQIQSAVANIKALCPNAKILYVSNCQYPFSYAQTYYWINLHKGITTCNTLNMDCMFGMPLWNGANYFHLTQAGQLFMMKQIASALTGGQIEPYGERRVYTDGTHTVTISVTRTGNIVTLGAIINSASTTSFTINIPNSQPQTCFGGFGGMFGGVGGAYSNALLQYDLAQLKFVTATATSMPYYFTVTIPIEFS